MDPNQKQLPAPAASTAIPTLTELLGHLFGPDAPEPPVSPCVCGGPRFVREQRPGGRRVVCDRCGRAHWQMGWMTASRWSQAG
jgi:hypothetical protein